MTFLDHLNLLKFDFMQNRSDGKIIKFLQSQALTSHFESFWSIVDQYFFIFLLWIGLLKHYNPSHPDYQSTNMAMVKIQSVIRKMSAKLQESVSIFYIFQGVIFFFYKKCYCFLPSSKRKIRFSLNELFIWKQLMNTLTITTFNSEPPRDTFHEKALVKLANLDVEFHSQCFY